MRLYGILAADVEATVRKPSARTVDARGNSRLTGQSAEGRPILVVVAADDPEFVITAFIAS
jgi:hypothetical protein